MVWCGGLRVDHGQKHDPGDEILVLRDLTKKGPLQKHYFGGLGQGSFEMIRAITFGGDMVDWDTEPFHTITFADAQRQRCADQSCLQQIESCSPVHLAFDELQSCD